VTLRGLEFSVPLAALTLPTASFAALPAGLHGVLDAYAAGLQAAIGISVGGSAGLTIEDCIFTIGNLGEANVFAAGISASGTMVGTTITGCTFQCADPPATVPFYELSTVAGTVQQPSALTPYQLTFGYLQTGGPEAAPGVAEPAAQVLDDAVLERNQFLGVTVPALALAQLGAVRLERNTASGVYGGFWLISLTGTALQQSTFAQFPVGDPQTYGQYATPGIAALADVILPLASQVGWVLPATPGGSPAGAQTSPFLQLDLSGNRIDATLDAADAGAGVVVADLTADPGSALIHGNRIGTRFPGGAAALVAGVGEASVTGNVMANAVQLPNPAVPSSYSLVLNPGSTPLAAVLTPPDKGFGDVAGVNAVAITGNVFVDPTSLPARPAATAPLGDWNALNTVFNYGLAAPPVVAQIAPATGPAGTTVTITGSGFTGATGVSFGTATATFALSSTTPDTQLTAIVPAGSGTVDVTVTTPSGTSPTVPADEFTFLAVTSVSPSSGQPPLTVTVYGSGFAPGAGNTTVNFGSNPGANVAVEADGTQISSLLPAGTGVVNVTVTVAGVTSPAVGAGQFSYLTVTRTNYPAGESVHWGGGVTLYGYGFIADQTTVTLTPGPTTGGQTYTVASSQIQVNADGTTLGFASPFPPAAALGAYLVTVTTPYGTSPGGVTLSYGGVHS